MEIAEERAIADKRLAEQLAHSDAQLAGERAAADKRLADEISAADDRLQQDRLSAQEQEQLAQRMLSRNIHVTMRGLKQKPKKAQHWRKKGR